MSDNVIIILKNCSVGLRSWCNTYCLQPYMALFVFMFMAATLHSFLKGFLSLPFLKLYLLLRVLILVFLKYWDFGDTNISVLHSPKEKELTEGDPVLKAKAGAY